MERTHAPGPCGDRTVLRTLAPPARSRRRIAPAQARPMGADGHSRGRQRAAAALAAMHRRRDRPVDALPVAQRRRTGVRIRSIRRSGEAIIVEKACGTPPLGTTLRGVITGDFNSAYAVRVTLSRFIGAGSSVLIEDGPTGTTYREGPFTIEHHRSIAAKFLGACKAWMWAGRTYFWNGSDFVGAVAGGAGAPPVDILTSALTDEPGPVADVVSRIATKVAIELCEILSHLVAKTAACAPEQSMRRWLLDSVAARSGRGRAKPGDRRRTRQSSPGIGDCEAPARRP